MGSVEDAARLQHKPRLSNNELVSSHSNEAYTIGWICAIQVEYVAARAFLDERHGQPQDVPRHDNNHYTLGEVCRHNVVIATLPDGEYGLVSAASVARDMLHAFPNVRIGLMVGIGGGVPSTAHDIRLGDVVVSSPGHGHGGVIQYDFGKCIQDESFHMTGFLNQPPTVLRTALTGLKAAYDEEGHELQADIENALAKIKKHKRYRRPEAHTDILYKSHAKHPQGSQESCLSSCGGGEDIIIERPKRDEENDDPAIHYGTIASADQLMKDAVKRDTLASQKNVLCFEMEAAGLMNHFPCLIIRGVCDYADTHKNKEWQGYAAMTAAAYAKDLLCQVMPSRVEEQRIGQLISEVRTSLAATEAHMSTINARFETSEDKELLDWLTPKEYDLLQSDIFGRHQEGTGQQLLDSDPFRAWVDKEGQSLFCPGIPGAGKTVLTSIIIDHLSKLMKESDKIGIAYVYCNYRQQSEQDAQHLLASLLKQLSRGCSRVPDELKRLYNSHKKQKSSPPLNELLEILHRVCSEYDRVYILVDALDECQLESRNILLTTLFALQDKRNINILATSRHFPDIEAYFEGCATFEIRADSKDVERYLETKLNMLPAVIRHNENLRHSICKEITEAVDGMFLLAQIYIQALDDKLTVRDVKEQLNKLHQRHQHPQEDFIKMAYDGLMDKVMNQRPGHRKLATRALAWITCAGRTLSTGEIRHALAVELGTTSLDQTNIPLIEDVVSVCQGLVLVDAHSDVIRLVHYTTQIYLAATIETWHPEAQDTLSEHCTQYLLFDTFQSGPCKTEIALKKRQVLYPFFAYAAENWAHHARRTSTVGKNLASFLKCQPVLKAYKQAVEYSSIWPWFDDDTSDQPTGIHLAASLGLETVVEKLIEGGSDPWVRDHQFRKMPLVFAAEGGHDAVVALLLRLLPNPAVLRMAGPDALSGALHFRHQDVIQRLLAVGIEPSFEQIADASWEGDKDVVELFLKSDPDPDSLYTLVFFRTDRVMLVEAIENGQDEMVAMMLDLGIDPNLTNGQTCPLSTAATRGRDDIASLLLAHGADPNYQDERMSTPLLCAAKNGHTKTVEVLLNSAADPNCLDEDKRSPLSWAAEIGAEDVVEQLLAKSATDPTLLDWIGRSPLLFAADNGHVAIVSMLLTRIGSDSQYGDNDKAMLSDVITKELDAVLHAFGLLLDQNIDEVDPSRDPFEKALLWSTMQGYASIVEFLLAEGRFGDLVIVEAFHRAVSSGHRSIVELLIESFEVDVDCTCRHDNYRFYFPAIFDAIHNDDIPMVELLLRNGASPGSLGQFGKSILTAAVERDNVALVQSLLDGYAVDINATGTLCEAFKQGNGEIIKLLLQRGAAVDTGDYSNYTSLTIAARKGHLEYVQLLINKGANVNHSTFERATPLSLSSEEGHAEVVSLLLEKGAIVDCLGMRRRTPLMRAAIVGREEVIKILIRAGASVDRMDVDHLTALCFAARGGNDKIVQMLLAGGASVDGMCTCEEHMTPLMYAEGNPHIVKLLATKQR